MVRGGSVLTILCAVSFGCSGGGTGSPDLSSPEGALAEYQRSLNERDWRAHYRLHSPESHRNLLIPTLLFGGQDPDAKEKLRAVFEKHGRAEMLKTPGEVGAFMQDPMSAFEDPEAYFVEAMEVLNDIKALDAKMVGFEDLEVDGDRATAKKIMKYASPAVFIDREPIHLLKIEGKWYAHFPSR